MTTQTTTQQTRATDEYEGPVRRHAPQPSLVEEILLHEAEQEQQHMAMLDGPDAAGRALRRAEGYELLRERAIKETEPIHWVGFKDAQGKVFARMDVAAAVIIGGYFGVHLRPQGKAEIKKDPKSGKQFAELYGDCWSTTTGDHIYGLRGKRFEDEDFAGRMVRTRADGSKYGFDAGLEDLKDCAFTSLKTKAVMHLSGIIRVSVEKLAKVWGKPVDEVMAGIRPGHGFSADERVGGARGTGVPITEPQAKRMFGMASGRLKALGQKGAAGDVVAACIGRIMGAKPTGEVFTPEEVTKEHYERICAMIEKWEPGGNGDAAKPAAAAPADPESAATPTGDLATAGQRKMLTDKANARAKGLPADAGIDGGGILHECIIDVCGADKTIEDVTPDQLPAIVGKINAWGKAS